MTKLYEVVIDGTVWLAVRVNGQDYLIKPLAPVGYCRRPGSSYA